MSVVGKERQERYEWADEDSMEVIEKGTGARIDLDKLMQQEDDKESA